MASADSGIPTLELYIVLWGSALWRKPGRRKVPWSDSSPRVVNEAATYMIWTYVRDLGTNWWKVLFQVDKPSVVGHAALLARMEGQPTLLFSNTGGNVGFYDWNDWKHWKHFPLSILVSCNVAESLAGHLTTGKWESLREFADRMAQRQNPRVQKVELIGEKAKETYAALADVKRQTELPDSGPGGPRHYGLNTKAVRLLSEMKKALPMKSYLVGSASGKTGGWGAAARLRLKNIFGGAQAEAQVIDGRTNRTYEIHGGCANAVASVLEAAGLESLIPQSSRFEMRITLSEFENAFLPVLVGSEAYDDKGNAKDSVLRVALDKLPKAWGSRDVISFIDPSYWVENILENDDLVKEFQVQTHRQAALESV